MRNYFLWLLIGAFSALVIYDIKYSVKDAHKITVQMEAELLKERQRMNILEVEWAMLTRPERISLLAAKHLPLTAINKERFMPEEDAMWRVSHEYSPEIDRVNQPTAAHNVNQIIMGDE
jgi:hypothetical protein